MEDKDDIRLSLANMGFTTEQIDAACSRMVDLNGAIEFIFNEFVDDEQNSPPEPDELPPLIEVNEPMPPDWYQRRGAINADSAHRDVEYANQRYANTISENFGSSAEGSMSRVENQVLEQSSTVSISLDEDFDVRDLTVPMGLNPSRSGPGTLVLCILQCWFSLPIVRRMILSLPTTPSGFERGFVARELQKVFVRLQFGTKVSTSASDIVESLLSHIANGNDANKQVKDLLKRCLTKASQAVMELISFQQRSVRNYEKFEQILKINDMSLCALFASNIKSHISLDDAPYNEAQQRFVYDLSFNKSISDTLDELFWPSSDLFFTIENTPRIITFLYRDSNKDSALPLQKELSLDRYFAKYIDEIQRIREQICSLQEDKIKIEEKLLETKFHGLALDEVLQYTGKYLKQEETSSGKDHTKCIDHLRELEKEQAETRRIYEELIRKSEEDIANSWNHMNNQTYQIHAIVVRSPGMTNYQVYIYNRTDAQWTKFCNRTVFKVDEEDIQNLFIPGKLTETPYLMFYLHTQDEAFGNNETTAEELFSLLPEHLQDKLKEKETAARAPAPTGNHNVVYQHSASPCSDSMIQQNSISQSPISNTDFVGKLEQQTSAYIESFSEEQKVNPTLNLRSFEYFLLSLECIEILQYFLADELHKEFYSTSLKQNHQFTRLLVHLGSIPSNVTSDDLIPYNNLYNACIEVLRYFVSGILAYNEENYEESIEWMQVAQNQDSLINLLAASRKEEIIRALKKTCLKLSESASLLIDRGKEQIAIAKAKLAIRAAVSLKQNYNASSALQELKAFWESYDHNAQFVTLEFQKFMLDVRFENFHPNRVMYREQIIPRHDVWPLYLKVTS